MSTDEIQIFDLLKEAVNVSVSAREIARRVGGRKRNKEEPGWIQPVLTRMILSEVIEIDERGNYRLKVRGSTNQQPEKLTMENYETWQLVLEPKKHEEAPAPSKVD